MRGNRLIWAGIVCVVVAAIAVKVVIGEEMNCTPASCDDGFAIDAADVAYALDAVRAVRLCVGSAARSSRAARRMAGSPACATACGVHRCERRGDLRRLAPNGEECGPICSSASRGSTSAPSASTTPSSSTRRGRLVASRPPAGGGRGGGEARMTVRVRTP